MGASGVQRGRLAALGGAALLLSAANAAIIGMAFAPGATLAVDLHDWSARLQETAAAAPAALGVLIGGPLLVLFALAPLLARRGMPTAPPPPPSERPAEDPAEGALQLLSLLQREGRVVDFFQEDLSAYDDAQVGAAVREIHAGCRRALQERLDLQPVLAGEDGTPVTIEAGFDPATIRITGNVSGDPPFRGVLRHGGWQTVKVSWPAPARGRNPSIIAPAEVEIP